MEVVELYSYCTLALLVCILSVDIALVCRCRTYKRCVGLGEFACILNLVATHLFGSLLHATAAMLIILSNTGPQSVSSYVNFFNNIGTTWFLSTTLVHTIVVTCLRIYSVSYGNRFLKFVSSSFNICLVVVKLWFVSLAITMVTVTSATATTNIVFYTGVSVTGLFAVICFFVTTERSSTSEPCDSTSLPRDQNIDGVRNPQKTFVVFTGVMISFVVFTVTACILKLYFSFQRAILKEQISLIVSLWCLMGVLANSVWMMYRLRCTLTQVTGFYSKWTEEEYDNTRNDIQQYVDNDYQQHMDVDDYDSPSKRHSFQSFDVIERQYASIASLEEQMRKEIT